MSETPDHHQYFTPKSMNHEQSSFNKDMSSNRNTLDQYPLISRRVEDIKTMGSHQRDQEASQEMSKRNDAVSSNFNIIYDNSSQKPSVEETRHRNAHAVTQLPVSTFCHQDLPDPPSPTSATSSHYDLHYPSKYHGSNPSHQKLVSQMLSTGGAVVRTYASGRREQVHPSSTTEDLFPDGYSCVRYANGNVKQTFPGGRMVEYFADTQLTQTTCEDGVQVRLYSGGQLEKNYADGAQEVFNTDGTIW